MFCYICAYTNEILYIRYRSLFIKGNGGWVILLKNCIYQ